MCSLGPDNGLRSQGVFQSELPTIIIISVKGQGHGGAVHQDHPLGVLCCYSSTLLTTELLLGSHVSLTCANVYL